MREFSSDEVVAHRFTSGRRRGYDTMEVDEYLEHLAEYVHHLQRERDRLRGVELASIDLLEDARQVAEETLAAARRDADALRRRARSGFEAVQAAARTTLVEARAESDRIVASAQERAEVVLAQSQERLADLEARAAARARELDGMVEELNRRVVESVGGLRAEGARLIETADHLQLEATARLEDLDSDLGFVDLRDDPVDAS